MSPQGGGNPSGPLAEQIKKDFGSYDAFKKQFSSAAEKVEGGGWAILVWSPRAGRRNFAGRKAPEPNSMGVYSAAGDRCVGTRILLKASG